MQIAEDFKVELAAFEIRFETSVLLWDRSGAIWQPLLDDFPTFVSSSAQPNQQAFETPNAQITLESGLMKILVRGERPVEELTKLARLFVNVATRRLELRTYTRVGFRLISIKDFPTSSEALLYAQLPEDVGDVLGGGAKRVGFLKSDTYETDTFGMTCSTRMEERKLAITIPWEISPHVTIRTPKGHTLVVDADFYTKGHVEHDMLDVEVWVNQASRAISRQWRRY